MPGTPQRTKAMVETAFLASLTAVLFFFAQVPLVGAFLCLGCPFPLTLMVYRHGEKQGSVGAAAAALVVFLMQGPLVLLALPFVLVGGVTGALLRRRVEPLRVVAGGGLALGLLFFAVAWPYENLLAEGQGWRSFRSLWTETVDRAAAWGAGRLELQEGTARYQALVERPRKLATYFGHAVAWMPLGVCLALGLLGFWVYYLVGGPILRRFEVEVPALPAFPRWRVPAGLGVALLGVLLLEASGLPGAPAAPGQPRYLFFLALNLQVLLELAYALSGAATLDARLEVWGLPWPLRRAGLLMLAGLPVPSLGSGYLGLALLGLVDSLRDLRPGPPPEPSEGSLGEARRGPQEVPGQAPGEGA